MTISINRKMRFLALATFKHLSMKMLTVWLFASMMSLNVVWGQNYPRGIRPGEDSLYQETLQKAPMTEELYRNVGSAASLKKYCPTPGYQKYGTCAAFASAYSARTITEAMYQGWTNPTQIARDAFSPGFIYKISEPNRGDCWGAFPSEILENMARYGVPKLSDFPTECSPSYPGQTAFNDASGFKIQGYVKLFSEHSCEKDKVQTVRKSISEGNPVVISMICPASFDKANDLWTPTESPHASTSGREHGRHAICVIGYDDNKYGGAFEIINSWSTNWGNGGFTWIKYTDFVRFIYQGLEMLPLKKAPIIEEPTELKGSVQFVENTGQSMDVYLKNGTYHFKNPYPGGTRFRMYINNNEPAYLYAFGTDRTGELFPIFPFDPSISPALTYSNNQVAIPSEEKHIRLDSNPGTDYMCLLYARSPLKIEEIKTKVRNGSGTFEERVKAALGKQLIELSEVNLHRDEIGFEAKSMWGEVVAVFLELEHR
ncbi:MAG: DUF4384 domain-containing protein [Bacteroidia bacterium]